MIAPRLIVISDTSVAPLGVIEARIEALCRAAHPGSVMVQLRDPTLPTRARVELGATLRGITRGCRQLLAVNDRADLAVLLEADALHLGESGIETADARRVVGSMWISRALHDPEHASQVEADAILLSPVIAARKGRPALGVEALHRCRASLSSRSQLFALGGVSADTARACLEHGAHGVAVIGAALAAEGPSALLEALEILAIR